MGNQGSNAALDGGDEDGAFAARGSHASSTSDTHADPGCLPSPSAIASLSSWLTAPASSSSPSPPAAAATADEPDTSTASDAQPQSQAARSSATAAVTPADLPALDTTSTDSDSAAPKGPRRVEQFYEVSSQSLGRGHYAVVCRGTCRRTRRAVAVKKIKRFLTDEKRLRAEIAVLQRVQRHPNIVELIDVFETAREVHLVLELCTGGELFERLADKGPYSEADCVRHIRDMARAMEYLHSQGIIHRDLKPENILLSSPDEETAVTKVADFGLARIFTGTSLKTKCGTWGYSAPEMISGSGTTFGYDFKVDSWSLGTIVYILLCGYHPFDPEGTYSDNEMIACIKSCRFNFEDEAWSTISEGARDLIHHLLVLDPDARFTMTELLAHPWITGDSELPSALPLSPSIHRDLARFREQQSKHKQFAFDSYDEDE